MTVATAPGKVILLGEHAVVYGRPAIAAPVWQTIATAEITDRPAGSGCLIVAADIGQQGLLAEATASDPLALVTRLALVEAGITAAPDWQIYLHSTIPIASGLGSGAALSTALVRAVLAHAGYKKAKPETISRIVYESERIYHGTPSGIDNSVIAYGAPIWFMRGHKIRAFRPARPFTLLIADSGIRSPTIETVAEVRRGWTEDPPPYEERFDIIARLVFRARTAIAQADWVLLGILMDKDQLVLRELGVSSPLVDDLVAAARTAGALGAKLSGGGRGGNVIALVTEAQQTAVEQALRAAGAVNVIATIVQ